MRATIFTLIDMLAKAVILPEPLYEFGAYRIPGQEARGQVQSCFPGKAYIGCDMRWGPGVDRIEDLHQLTLADTVIGTALLLDTIEHVREPWRAMAELHRCLRPGGIIIMTSVMFFPIHAYPDDYWRFTTSGFSSLLQSFDPIAVEMCGINKFPHTVIGIASKGPVDAAVGRAICDTVASWKHRGASSWRELVMAVAPPFLFGPAYGIYDAILQKRVAGQPEKPPEA